MSLASVLAQLSRGGGLPQRFRPFANQAANEAYLRFAPEWEGLNQLRAQSASTMRQSVGQANSAAQLISALANESQRNLNANTNPVIQRAAQYEGTPGSTGLAGTGLALSLGGTNALLSQAAMNAPIRASQQAQQALAAHQQDLEQIGGKRASLAGQVGAFTQGRLGDLVGDDRKLRHDANTTSRKIKAQLDETNARLEVTKRGQDLSHQDRQDAITQREKNAAGSPKLPGGVKVNTPQQHGALKDSVGSALAVVQQQRRLGRSRHEIAQTLINGRPAQTITLSPGDPGYDPKNPSANKVKVPALPKVGQLALSVALDQAFDNHVSGHNVNELHRRGYSVKTLGFSTTKPKPRPKRRAPSRKVNVPLGPAGPLSS